MKTEGMRQRITIYEEEEAEVKVMIIHDFMILLEEEAKIEIRGLSMKRKEQKQSGS